MYRRREDILAEMLASLVAAVPDAYVGEDGVIRIVFEIDAGQLENLYLANQILLEDMFVTTASYSALVRHGQVYGIEFDSGLAATGTLRFEGAGNTFIPMGAEVAYDPGGGLDPVYYNTTSSGTIPDPGDPDIPTVALNATAGNLNGLYEYVVSFVTTTGETLTSSVSQAVAVTNQQMNLSGIEIGGPGTISRRIYRALNGSGIFRRITEIANNTATTFTDNVTDAVMNAGSLAPTSDTAHRIDVQGMAQVAGVEGNAAVGTITVITNAPATLTSVSNTTPFSGGHASQDTEDFRQELLTLIRNPGTGSPSDLKQWAEEVDGVESATVYPNSNLAGVTTPGTVAVRITGIGGTIPSTDLITAVQTALLVKDMANVTIEVGSFTSVTTDVTVDVTVSGTYALVDITPSVQTAITNYINSLQVGETLKISGIIDAVYGLAGISDVVVTTPATNQTTGTTSKRVSGVITVV